MPEALKDCPFCGGKAEIDTCQGYRNISTARMENACAIYCTACSAQHTACYTDMSDTPREDVQAAAITAWNTRAKADQIMGVEGEEITEAVHAWVREDLPLGAQMTAGFHIQKLISRLQALKGPTHD